MNPKSESAAGEWKMVHLKELLSSSLQPGFPCGEHARNNIGIAHLRPMNVSTEGEISLADLRFVPKNKVKGEQYLAKSGDIIFNNTNSPELVGKTAYYDLAEPRAFSNHMTKIQCDSKIADPHFIAHQLHQLWRSGYFASRCNNHVSQASIGRKVLLEVPLVVPSMKTQTQIVQLLEAILPRARGAKGMIEKGQKAIREFRQSLLWSICEEYEKVPLGGLLEDLRYGTAKKCDYGIKGLAVLRIPNIGNGVVSMDNLKFAHFTKKEEDKLRLRTDDVLMIRSNGSASLVGKVAIVGKEAEGSIFAGYLMRLRANKNLIVPQFLVYMLSSLQIRQHIEANARSTSGVHNINSGEVEALMIPLPPLEKQNQIIDRVQSYFEVANRVETALQKTERDAELVSSSILARFFAGAH